MPRRDRRVLVALTLLSSLCLLAEAAGALAPALLYAAPLLIVALPLIAGRYVGEERIARLVRTVQRRRRRCPVGRMSPPAGTRRALRAVPRGGRLIASSLAVRPPPAAPALG
jgi:hypothetical protein